MTRSSRITTRGGPSRIRGDCAPKTWISSEGKNSGFCSCWFNRQAVNRWRWNETVNDRNSNALTSQGIMDMKFLARRYASKFEDLMREPYSENTYSFQYTDTDRTHDSYQAYIEGLFKNNAYQVHANVFNTDRLIKVLWRAQFFKCLSI
jgi:hypothetical protein